MLSNSAHGGHQGISSNQATAFKIGPVAGDHLKKIMASYIKGQITEFRFLNLDFDEWEVVRFILCN